MLLGFESDHTHRFPFRCGMRVDSAVERTQLGVALATSKLRQASLFNFQRTVEARAWAEAGAKVMVSRKVAALARVRNPARQWRLREQRRTSN